MAHFAQKLRMGDQRDQRDQREDRRYSTKSQMDIRQQKYAQDWGNNIQELSMSKANAELQTKNNLNISEPIARSLRVHDEYPDTP